MTTLVLIPLDWLSYIGNVIGKKVEVKVCPTMDLSPEGRCVAYSVGVQLFLLMFYFGLGRVYCTFKNRLGFLRFLNLENVLSPEGRCVAHPVGVQLFLFVTYFGLENV